MNYIHIMSIAGSDCSGGAGIQADIKTISALGCYASSVITGVTVQNTCGVTAVHPVPAEIVSGHIHAIRTDMRLDAIKIGMVTDCAIIDAITQELKTLTTVPVVFDPVLVSSSGYSLATPEALVRIKKALIPLCNLLTPNLPEAALLSGVSITDESSLAQAACKLLQLGCQNVLIKGGHRAGEDMTDVLFSANTPTHPISFTAEKIRTNNTHGTGCTLSSAIASHIAMGYPLSEAISLGKKYLTNALLSGASATLGHGHGPLNHFFAPQKAILQ